MCWSSRRVTFARFWTASRCGPLLFFAERASGGLYIGSRSRKTADSRSTINQFRSIVMRAGTDPKQVAMLSAALEKVARSPDFVKYLEDELAFADSFIPAAQAGAFLERELKSIEQNAPKKQ